MPKFTFSIGILILGLAYILIRIMNVFEPSLLFIRPVFLILFGTEVFLISSLVLFALNRNSNKFREYIFDKRKVYRYGLKKSAFIALSFIGVVGMKIYSILNPLTGTLYCLFIISLCKLRGGNHK